MERSGRGIYSKMLSSIILVINNESVENVGGFAIPVVYDQGRFMYFTYRSNFRRPIDVANEFAENESVPVQWLGAAEGSYSVNFSGSYGKEVAIHIEPGNILLSYSQIDKKFPEVDMKPNFDQFDFNDYTKNSSHLIGGITLEKSVLEHIKKGSKVFKSGQYLKSIEYLDKAENILSREWIKSDFPNKQYEGLQEARKENEVKVPSDHLEVLKYILNSRGAARIKIEDFENALADSNTVLEIDKNNRIALTTKGICLANRGDLNEAVSVMTDCIKLHDCLDCYQNRGLCYYKLDDLPKAKQDFTTVVKSAPSASFAKSYLSKINSKLSR